MPFIKTVSTCSNLPFKPHLSLDPACTLGSGQSYHQGAWALVQMNYPWKLLQGSQGPGEKEGGCLQSIQTGPQLPTSRSLGVLACKAETTKPSWKTLWED